MSTLVEQLSTYAATLRYEDVPADVVRQAQRLIVDTVGCALGGYWSEPARIARDIASTVRSSEPVTLECSIKRFPLGQYSQTVVEAALELRAQVGPPEEIAEIRIETVTTAIKLMAGDPDKWEPATRETADHSMPYTVAVALLHGSVEEQHFGERYLRDPKIRALTKRVKVKATEEADGRMPEAMLCRMEIVTNAGQSFKAVVEYHRGHWKNPMSDGEVEAKFRKLAAEVLKPEQGERLLDALWRLDELADAGEILRLTRSG